MQRIFVFGMALLSLLYLLNPTAGVFEIIPDNFPFFGNLDEATAATILLACLRYYGWDLTRWLRRPESAKDLKKPVDPPKAEK